MVINLLILVFVIVYIVDYSGIIYDLSSFLYKLLNPTKKWNYQMIGKPFGCSGCLSWWIGLGYALFNTSFIYALGIGVLCAIGSVYAKKIIGFVLHLANKL